MSELSLPTIMAFIIYVTIVLAIGFYAYVRTKNASDYFLGGRNLSPAVSAISAGASDMSGWVLLGLPGYAYMAGLEAFWITLGLTIGVAANWMLMAKRLRLYSVLLDDAVTVPAYLQRRFDDTKPWLKIIAGLAILLFFLFYVGSGLIAGGKLFNAVFGLDYNVAVFAGVVLILFYTLFGGFLAVSWTDVFQGLLMLAALIAVPVLVISNAGGLVGFANQVAQVNPELLNIFTNAKGVSLSGLEIISLLGWGLGYFGLPHVLARFKAIRSADEVGVATVIGVSWSFIGYLMAILVGLCGTVYLANPLADSERVFIELTSLIFHPLIAGVLLAAILAAIMSTVDSQLLVCSATLAEDLYPMLVKSDLTPEKAFTDRPYCCGCYGTVGDCPGYETRQQGSGCSVLCLGWTWCFIGTGYFAQSLLALYDRGGGSGRYPDRWCHRYYLGSSGQFGLWLRYVRFILIGAGLFILCTGDFCGDNYWCSNSKC